MCVQPSMEADECARPMTPPHLKKYRKSYTGQPGFKSVHPGLFEDVENLDKNAAYGKPTNAAKSEHVNKVLKA